MQNAFVLYEYNGAKRHIYGGRRSKSPNMLVNLIKLDNTQIMNTIIKLFFKHFELKRKT